MDLRILEEKRILILHDDPDVLETVQKILASSQVITAGSFDEAQPLIAGGSFDLVILDIVGLDGFFLLEVCCKNRLPVAAFTFHAMHEDSLNAAIRLGVVS